MRVYTVACFHVSQDKFYIQWLAHERRLIWRKEDCLAYQASSFYLLFVRATTLSLLLAILFADTDKAVFQQKLSQLQLTVFLSRNVVVERKAYTVRS